MVLRLNLGPSIFNAKPKKTAAQNKIQKKIPQR